MRDGPDIAQLITLMNNLSRLSYPLNEENVLISLKKNVVMDDSGEDNHLTYSW